MSRCISIKALRRANEGELRIISGMTRKEIILSFDTIFSLYEDEIDDEFFTPMKELMQPVNTIDNKKMYVSMCTFRESCSDELLGLSVLSRIPDYKPGTYADITFLAGETMDAKKITFDEEENEKERKISFSFPPCEKGTHIFYFDDMD